MGLGPYDVIIVGGGHAGAEAAWAAARLGAAAALVTFDIRAIGRPSCNPAIGGIGKGQIVREVDALGGLMGLVTDETGIQFRILNRRKGPAVWAPRAQIDSDAYPAALRRRLEHCPNLRIVEGGVEALLAEEPSPTQPGRRVTGVVLADDRRLAASAVVITAGTFLRGLMHTGEQQTPGGRVGEAAANRLSDSLESFGVRLGRLKTGTPPRIARDTVDYSALAEQQGDPEPVPMSAMTDRLSVNQVPCWLAATNAGMHDLIRANLERAPLYTGQISSRGPRYCPSIEDKVVRFPDKASHQLFLEPEGRNSERIYLNGLSTSLPADIQERLVASIPGLERARIVQWGYAIEYDFIPPEQIDATLMVKCLPGLFSAGQLNGTSGYEEAAGQGLVAGINAARFVAGREPVVLGRGDAYIGVMIDDLVTRGVTEPYRMFTSRAEHRMHLRIDNADSRLTRLGREVGLVDDARWERFREKEARRERLRETFQRLRYEGRTLSEWLRRPNEDGLRFLGMFEELKPLAADLDVWASVVVEVKYSGYLERQRRLMAQAELLEQRPIPSDFNYGQIKHLRHEARERWEAVRPRSVGQAARVSGIHPTDVSILLVQLAALARANN